MFWSKQVEITESLCKHRYTAVKSCHDGGKSFSAAVTVCWWLDTRPLGDAFAVTTAPTAPQVSAILWREIEKLHRKAQLQGRISTGGAPEWKVGKELIGYGRKPSDYDEAGFQGIHAKYPLIVVDEACGIPKQLWDAIDALATNINARVLAIGNPDDATSHFYTLCKPDSGWNVIEIDGLQTPNFTREAVSVYPVLAQFMEENGIPYSTEAVSQHVAESLLSVQWVAERMARWGVIRKDDGTWATSPLWEAKVRGKFSTDSTSGVIPLAWVNKAIQRWHEHMDSGARAIGPRVLGVDVAREGDDDTCIVPRTGHVVDQPQRYSKQDTMETADRVFDQLAMRSGSEAWVDVIGVGGGVYDRLTQRGCKVHEFNVTRDTKMLDLTRTFRFDNVYSAAWWNLRELLDPANDPHLCLPPDEQMVADLTAPRWRVAKGSKIVVEPKESVKRRLKRSPDTGDGVVACTWNGGRRERGHQHHAVDYGGSSEYAQGWDDHERVGTGW